MANRLTSMVRAALVVSVHMRMHQGTASFVRLLCPLESPPRLGLLYLICTLRTRSTEEWRMYIWFTFPLR